MKSSSSSEEGEERVRIKKEERKKKKNDNPCIRKEEQEKILKALDERVCEHDDSRRVVQEKVCEICGNLRKHVDELEERVNKELEVKFVAEDERLQEAFNALRTAGSLPDALAKARAELRVKQTYDVVKSKSTKLSMMYKLETRQEELDEAALADMTAEELVEALERRLDEHNENRVAVQEKNTATCGKLKRHIDELEERVNSESEERFIEEDNCIQEALNELKMFMLSQEEEDENEKDELDSGRDETLRELVKNARHSLLVRQTYGVTKKKGVKLQNLYELVVQRAVLTEWLERPKPAGLEVTGFTRGRVRLAFAHLTAAEEAILRAKGLGDALAYEAVLYKGDDEQVDVFSTSAVSKEDLSFEPVVYEAEATLSVKVRAVCQGRGEAWSRQAKFATPRFGDCCVWKACPAGAPEKARYTLAEGNRRRATMVGELYCTVAGTAAFPFYKVTAWHVKIVRSLNGDGNGIYVGVAPFDAAHGDWGNKQGWYLDCFSSTLRSGKPHDYNYKAYGPRKKGGEYVRAGGTVGLLMDAKRGELSFVLDGVNLGAAYVGIPLDRPLVPCVRFRNEGDCVELDVSEVTENVNHGMAVPRNVAAKSHTWDSVTLTWDEVGGASYYQFEVDGSRSCEAAPGGSTVYTMAGLLEDAVYTFRVRAVKGNEVSDWSKPVKERVLLNTFENAIWKACPGDVDADRRYAVSPTAPRVATRVGGRDGAASSWCTIVGNTPLPRKMVVSWEVRLLNLKKNKGHEVLVGVAPASIDQNYDANYERCGWYFECYYSKLYAGPPNDVYLNRKYKPRKKNGKFVHTGDSVGVAMDTTKGSLSFYMNEINYGLAFDRIPLDKPLVPCVLLLWKDNSIELANIKVETPEQYKKRNKKCLIC